MARTNKDKDPDPLIDEVLNEDIPVVEEVSDPTEVTDIPADEILADPENEDPNPDPVVEEVVEEKVVTPPVETPEQKDLRYRSQQTEAQIQYERNKALVDKVDEAAQIKDPTIEELKGFVSQDGINWDELTNFEQATAKRTYLAEKRFQLVNESVQNAKRVDEWAKTVDDFIDSTDGKPEYLELSSHEVDFRKFALKESHRGTPVDVLLGAFLHSLPVVPPKRGSLFDTSGGGEKEKQPTGIVDADQAAALRRTNPREYARQLKAGKIKIEI